MNLYTSLLSKSVRRHRHTSLLKILNSEIYFVTL